MDPTLALAILALLNEAAYIVSNTPQSYAPIDVRTGCDGYNAQSAIGLAQDPQQWKNAWLNYRVGPVIGNGNFINSTPTDSPPPIDFEKNFVVVVFGPASSVTGYDVADSFKEKNEIHLRLRPIQMPSVGAAASVQVYPYAFLVFKRTSLPIDVEFPSVDAQGNVTWTAAAKLVGQDKPAGQ